MADLFVTHLEIPEKDKLIQILQDGLKENFAEVTVEWVDCPDLTKAPFNFVSPGLCGNPALIEIGGTGYLFPLPEIWRQFKFDSILRYINRHQKNSFVIGASACRNKIKKCFGELIMNAAFEPTADGNLKLRCKNYIASVNKNTKKCQLDYLTNYVPMCSMNGRFFISEGKPGPVFKVSAKKRTGLEFVEAIQSALSRNYPLTTFDTQRFVGLGGTFVVNNAKVKVHVMPDWTKPLTTRKDIHDWLYYYEIDAPIIAVGTIFSKDRMLGCIEKDQRVKELHYTTKHFYAFSQCGKAGHYYTDIESSDTVEYVGYFSLTKNIYRLDPAPLWRSLSEFSYIKSCW